MIPSGSSSDLTCRAWDDVRPGCWPRVQPGVRPRTRPRATPVVNTRLGRLQIATAASRHQQGVVELVSQRLFLAGVLVLASLLLAASPALAQFRRFAVSKDDPAELTKACQAGKASACFDLAGQYDLGERVGVDASRAAELYLKACDGGEARGCLGLAGLVDEGRGVAKDEAEALRWYREAAGQRFPAGLKALNDIGQRH